MIGLDWIVVQAGASQLSDVAKTPMVHCKGPDGEDFSSINVFGTLGITSLPAPYRGDGYTEYLVNPNLGIAIAARDTRIADVVGQLSAGDTAVHSTGSQHASRLFLKEDSRIAALLVKDSDGKDMGIVIDGVNKKIQIFLAGQMFQLDAASGISIGLNGTSLILTTSNATLTSGAVLLGAAPTIASPVAYGVAGPVNLISTSVFVST